MEVASLPVGDVAAVYRAALAGSFTLDDPALWLLADTMLLPRTAGLEGGLPMPPELLSLLRGRGIIRGTCALPIRPTREPLTCRVQRAGYVIRFSEPFALGRDSVQVHIAVQQYALPGGPAAERLRFERAYHVIRRGGAWRAVREGRMPQP